MEWISDPNIWLGLLTLTALEIVLGIDNIIFISILAAKVRPEHRARARTLGLMGAFLTRLALLFSVAWLVTLTKPLVTVFGAGISGRDLIVIAGGLFLIVKATFEIHSKIEGQGDETIDQGAAAALGPVVAQIMVLDIVFSLDSVITAVGMVDRVAVMVGANVIALCIMLFAAGPIGRFVERHPTIKMLALSFLLLIGTNLIAEGFGIHIPKGYTYFAMAFAVLVELLNLRVRDKRDAPQRGASSP